MELIGNDMEEKQRKSKRTMTYIVIALIILLMVSIALGVLIFYLKLKLFKVKVDNVSTRKFSSEMIVFDNNNMYVSLKDVSTLIGYKYYNGGYKQYTEDENKCYMECDNEIVTFERGSDLAYKTSPNELDYTYYELSEPIKKVNQKLYINSKDIGVCCNIQIGYTENNNTVSIYTLPYLVKSYSDTYPNAAISSNFNNQKALLYGLLVVKNTTMKEEDIKNSERENIRYGINNLQNEEIVGMKYKKIEFVEGTEEFLVTTEENKVGLITSDGDTRVNPQYDALKQIDKSRNLYLATNNGRSGVIERNGKILIYLEYDQVGIDANKFPINDIKNKYILFDNAIPVMQNNKWGMYDVRGKLILPLEYDSFGCESSTSSSSSNTDKNLNSIVIIPDIDGIVIGKDFIVESQNSYSTRPETVRNYGIFNSKGELLVPVRLSTVYSTTVSGQEKYTMIFEGQSYDVIEYIRRWILPDTNASNPAEQTNNITDGTESLPNDEIQNTVTNETTTETVAQPQQQVNSVEQITETVTTTTVTQ